MNIDDEKAIKSTIECYIGDMLDELSLYTDADLDEYVNKIYELFPTQGHCCDCENLAFCVFLQIDPEIDVETFYCGDFTKEITADKQEGE